jgi:hypothetical protein
LIATGGPDSAVSTSPLASRRMFLGSQHPPKPSAAFRSCLPRVESSLPSRSWICTRCRPLLATQSFPSRAWISIWLQHPLSLSTTCVGLPKSLSNRYTTKVKSWVDGHATKTSSPIAATPLTSSRRVVRIVFSRSSRSAGDPSPNRFDNSFKSSSEGSAASALGVLPVARIFPAASRRSSLPDPPTIKEPSGARQMACGLVSSGHVVTRAPSGEITSIPPFDPAPPTQARTRPSASRQKLLSRFWASPVFTWITATCDSEGFQAGSASRACASSFSWFS